MKKNVFSVFAMFIAVVFSALCFSACQQDEEILSATSSTDDIVIKMSAPSADGLRSASNDQAIKEGDTVNVQNITDINIIISAEDYWGNPIDGYWALMNIDNDRNISQRDTFAINNGGRGALGYVISAKLKFLGLYQVIFSSKMGTKFSFYIRHTGIPGNIGDDMGNDYSFRLNKENYQINNQQGYVGYTLYVKYEEGEFPDISREDVPNPSLPQNFHAMVYCGGDNFFFCKDGWIISAKEFSLKKCKYSPGYVCFSFVTDNTPSLGADGKYSMYFYSGDFGQAYWAFKSVAKSDWSSNEMITFQGI